MKKVLIASGVAVMAFAMVAGAATFNANLTVGSIGADVVALQTALITAGYNIPAIASGAAQKGYFGSQTKAAVVKFQEEKGIITPGTGFVGPLTRGVLNGGTVAVAPAGCPTGFVCTPIAGTNPIVVTPGTPLVMDGTDGSVLPAYSSYVTSEQSIKKGETKNVFAVNLQATGGKVSVNRFDVHFTERPWLDFSSVTLKDSSGAVIATKALSSYLDATEVTVGSNYVVRFDNIGYVVTPGTISTLVVGVTVQAASDKVIGQPVGVSVPNGSIRTINGKGYIDTFGLGGSIAMGGDSVNTVTLQSTAASSGSVYSAISSNTPNTRSVTISTTQTTPDVILGVFSLKSQTAATTINSLNFNIHNSKNTATTTVFSNVRLVVNGQTYGANSLVALGTTFINMNFVLPADVWTDVKLIADVNANQSVTASSTFVAAGIVGIDSNFNTPTITTASNVTANDVTLSTTAIAISNITSTKGSIGTISTSAVWANAHATLGFAVTNNSNAPIYISKIANTALATSTSLGANASTTVSDTTVTGSTTGDSTDAYYIGVNSSKTFTYSLYIDNTNGTGASKTIAITQINYGTASDGTVSANVNYGLETLKVQMP